MGVISVRCGNNRFWDEPSETIVTVSLDDGAFMPERAHKTDAGLDLRTPEAFTLFSWSSATIDTGVHVQLPPNTCGLMVSKSGLNVNEGITSTGLIDEGYSGSIMVRLYNHDERPRKFEVGDKISQLVILPCIYAEAVDGDVIGGDRGSEGFGSTGR